MEKETRKDKLYGLLVACNGIKAEKKEILKIIPEYQASKSTSHDICPVIYQDIYELNLVPEKKIIIYKNNLFWIASEEEAKIHIATMFKNRIKPLIDRALALSNKLSVEGRYDLFKDDFIEVCRKVFYGN